jgi:hypothetical protein
MDQHLTEHSGMDKRSHFLIAQFEALREEMDHKDQMRLGAIKFAIIASGICWGVFLTNTNEDMNPFAPLATMVLIWLCAFIVVHHVAAIRKRIGALIMKVEVDILGNQSSLGWETHLNSVGRSRWHYWLVVIFCAASVMAGVAFAYHDDVFPKMVKPKLELAATTTATSIKPSKTK